jgi:hypothetical protein
MSKKRSALDPAALQKLRGQVRTGAMDEESRKTLDALPAAVMELLAELQELAAESDRLEDLARQRGIDIPPDLQRDIDELRRAAGATRP